VRLVNKPWSETCHRGRWFPRVWPCDCGGAGCEAMLDEIAAAVLAGGLRA
jgi:hypothetical protein